MGPDQGSVDLAASCLPINVRAPEELRIRVPHGAPIVLNGDLGDKLLALSLDKLSPNGVGIFVVSPSFFQRPTSAYRQLGALGFSVSAAFALPSGTFSYTQIQTYLVVIVRGELGDIYVAKASSDREANQILLERYRKRAIDADNVDGGRLVPLRDFQGIDHLRYEDYLACKAREFGYTPQPVSALSEIKQGLVRGRSAEGFVFPACENAIYVPLVGSSNVCLSPNQLKLKPANYVQIALDPSFADARYVAGFLNSETGKRLLEFAKAGSYMPRLSLESIRSLPIFIPTLERQVQYFRLESNLAEARTVVSGLGNEIEELHRKLWAQMPSSDGPLEDEISRLSGRLSDMSDVGTMERFDIWFESLPFPIASVLRAWKTSHVADHTKRRERLLHALEATAQFFGTILLSAFRSSAGGMAQYAESIRGKKIGLLNPTFGTWCVAIEALGGKIRDCLDRTETRALVQELFFDDTCKLASALSHKDVLEALRYAKNCRNSTTGHGGIANPNRDRTINEELLNGFEKIRCALSGVWDEFQLIRPISCRRKGDVFETDLEILSGSNSSFEKDVRMLRECLSTDRLYVLSKRAPQALELLPFVRMGPEPLGVSSACYFFQKYEDDSSNFVSYHYADRPDLHELDKAVNASISAAIAELAS